MMIQINLLPPTQRQALRPLKGLLVLGIIVTMTVAMTLISYNLYTIWRLEKEIAAAQQQFSLLRPTQEKMVLASGINQLAADKNALLVRLTAERKSWHAILTRLGMITPANLWLTEVAVADKGELIIKGNALTYPDLAGFLQQLEQDEQLTTPQLIQAEREVSLAVIRFELTVRTKGM